MKAILGYSDKLSLRAGETIDFKLSAQPPCEAKVDLVRIVNADIYSENPDYREEIVEADVPSSCHIDTQKICAGSCMIVPGKPFEAAFREVTITLRCQPTLVDGRYQQLIGRWKDSLGWSLGIDSSGRFSFRIDGKEHAFTVTTDVVAQTNSWYEVRLHLIADVTVALRVEALREKGAFVDSPTQSTSTRALQGGLPETSACLGIGGAPSHMDNLEPIRIDAPFDGRIENPALFASGPDTCEIPGWMAGATAQHRNHACLAAWDFSKELHSRWVRDCSPYGRHGELYNLPTRAVRSSRWDGSSLDCRAEPTHYAAIHFHSDDLYDCRWRSTISLTIDSGLASGVYALRVQSEDSEEYLPFFLTPPRNGARAPLAFLVPTYSYLAYANNDILENLRQRFGVDEKSSYAFMGSPGTAEYDALIRDHKALGASTYDLHADGSPIHFSSWLRPILNLRPKSILWTFCADMLFVDWMERIGINYDIITDDLLDQDGLPLLQQYRAVMTGNHPEYPTTRMMNAIEAYLMNGGRLLYLGGNGFYWRTASGAEWPCAIEVRRGRVGTQSWKSEVGEVQHQFNEEYGGLWRENGRAPQRLFGVGFVAQGNGPSYYRWNSDLPARVGFITEGCQEETFGHGGLFGGAAGEEIDSVNFELGTPPHTVILASSEKHGPGMMYAIEEMHATYPHEVYQPFIRADVVFYETPNGGAVFSTGSMAWCGSLRENGYRNPVSRITQNVVNRFIDPARFSRPEEEQMGDTCT